MGGREGPLCFLGEGGRWAVVVTAARVPVPDGKDLVPAGSPRRSLALAGVGLPSRGARCRTDSESSLCTWRFPAFRYFTILPQRHVTVKQFLWADGRVGPFVGLEP